MRFKEEFIRELIRRLKENIDIVESSFTVSGLDFVKNKVLDIDPIEFHLTLLVEHDPYLFLNKIVYCIVNKQELKVSTSNIACELLLELVNLILDEFNIERIEGLG